MAAAFTAAIFLAAPAGATPAPLATSQQIEALFEAALAATNSGHPRQAILGFRRILSAHPGLVRVRLELARALYLAGDLGKARSEFLIALSAPGVPKAVKLNILKFIRHIDAGRGFFYSARLGLTSPDGAGRHYKSDAVALDIFHTGHPIPFTLVRPSVPHHALLFDGTAQRVLPFGGSDGRLAKALYLRGHLRVVDAKGASFDAARLDVTPGLRLAWPRTTLSLGFVNSQLFEAGDASEFRSGLSVELDKRTIHGVSLSVDATRSHVVDQTGNGGTGRLTQLGLTVQKSLRGSGYVGARLSWQKKIAANASLGYAMPRLDLFRKVDLRGGLSLLADAYFEYYGQSGLTPGFIQRQKDHELGLDLEMTRTDLLLANRYLPYVSVSLVRHVSPISAFSYDGAQVGFGLKNAF